MYKNDKVLAIIPARAGSKRLVNKNIQKLNGKPLICWTIDSAKKSRYIDKIVVSTDSKEIQSLATDSGVEAPFIRPAILSNDTADSLSVLKHSIEFFKNQFEYVILLQPTSPLRNSDDIDNAIEIIDDNIPAIVSVCKTEHSPLWTNVLPHNLSMKNFLKEEVKNKRAQDLPEFYRINGAIYIASINYLYANNGFLGNKTKAFVMPQKRSVDIDNIDDFNYAEFLMVNK